MVSFQSAFINPTTVRGSSGWSNVGGAASLAAAVADNTDNTYMDQILTTDWTLHWIDFNVEDIITSNLLSFAESSFETNYVSGEETTTLYSPGANTTIARQTYTSASTRHGQSAMSMISVAAGDVSAQLARYVPVSPSTQYTALGSFYKSGTVRSARVDIEWYDSAKVLISTTTGTAVTEVDSSYTQAATTVTSPATAAFARIKPYVVGTGAASELHLFDKGSLHLGASTTWALGSIPVGAKIDSVHSHMRIKEATTIEWPRTYPQNFPAIIQHLGRGNRMYGTYDRLIADPDSFIDYRWGHWATPDGKEWLRDDLNNLILSVHVNEQHPHMRWQVAATRLEIWFNERPAVDVTGPTGTLTNTVRPEVTYDYEDAEDDPQISHRVKIFTAAQYGAADFDPVTSPAVWDSGEEFSGFGLRKVGKNLVNTTTYRTYVRVRQSWPRVVHESLWDYSEFTIDLIPLATPTLTVTPQPTSVLGPRVELAIGGATAANTLDIEYSDDTGVTWKDHPRVTDQTGATSYTLHDYELPDGVSRRYRVRQVNADQTNSSAFATSTDQSLTFTQSWLKDVEDASKNARILVNHPLNLIRREDQGVFWPLGPTSEQGSDDYVLPIVVTGDIRSREGELEMSFTTQAEWDVFEAIRKTKRVLLLQLWTGDQMWVKLGGVVRETRLGEDSDGDYLRQAGVNYVEVAEPA